MEFHDLRSNDDRLMDENEGLEILDKGFVQVNQEQIKEDDILVHNLQDEHDGGRDENKDEGDNGDDNKDADHEFDDASSDYL